MVSQKREDFILAGSNSIIPSFAKQEKREQERLLKGLTITDDDFIAFVCQAGEKLGFKLSQYKSEHLYSDVDDSKLPKLFYATKKGAGKIESIGQTDYSEGKLKQILEQRTVIVAKFLDNDTSWHCFFFTYRSLRGEERWQHPHLHYISNTWGLSRANVVSQLKEKNYSLPSMPHINFISHWDGKVEEE